MTAFSRASGVALIVGTLFAFSLIGCQEDAALTPGDTLQPGDVVPGVQTSVPCDPCPPITKVPQKADGTSQLYFGGPPGTALSGRIEVTISVSDSVAGLCPGDDPACPSNCSLTVTVKIKNNNTTTPFSYKWDGVAKTIQPGYSKTHTWSIDEACGTKLDLPMTRSNGQQFYLKKSNGKKFKFGCEDCPDDPVQVDVRELDGIVRPGGN